MKYLLPSAVLILMVSIGMSLRFREIVANWRRLTWANWTRLLLATFLVPPLIALGLGQLLPLSLATTAGLFLLAVAPGAPLLTRNIAKQGFDMQMAASYQVWSALMIPIMVPLLVALAGKLYQRDIWIPPLTLLAMICEQQFLPLLAGMALMHFAPTFCIRARGALNIFANLVLTVVLIALLWKMGPALKETSPWLLIAVPALAVGCVAVSRMLLTYDTPGAQTLVICNVNRHAGLALLLSGQYLRTNNNGALPSVACYALAAPLIMGLYARFASRDDATPPSANHELKHRMNRVP